ncbi:hypothetical protein HZS_1954, partial [Henneguya salminicola]
MMKFFVFCHYFSKLRSVQISDLVENINFMNMIYNCINLHLCKSEALITLSLNVYIFFHDQIINICIEDNIFIKKFCDTRGISRICSLPNIASSSEISKHILLKLLNCRVLFRTVCTLYNNKIAEKDIDTSILIMRYVLKNIQTSQDYHGVAFIINSFQYKNFYEIFLKEGGIKQFYSTLRETKWFCSLKSSETSSKDQIKEIYDANKIFLKYSIRLLLIHIIRQIYIYLLKDISHSLPPFDVINFSYKYVDKIIKLIQKKGIIRYEIEFYE